jgi:hypothetical protein
MLGCQLLGSSIVVRAGEMSRTCLDLVSFENFGRRYEELGTCVTPEHVSNLRVSKCTLQLDVGALLLLLPHS